MTNVTNKLRHCPETIVSKKRNKHHTNNGQHDPQLLLRNTNTNNQLQSSANVREIIKIKILKQTQAELQKFLNFIGNKVQGKANANTISTKQNWLVLKTGIFAYSHD